MCTFVKKECLAIDRKTREIVGVHLGDRGTKSAEALWQSIPDSYCRYAIVYTDYWSAYNGVIFDKQHYSVGKETGLTNHIERFNNILRQRLSRLVRKTLSFFKKQDNLIGSCTIL